MRKNVLEAKGVLPALVLGAGALPWPRRSYEALKEGRESIKNSGSSEKTFYPLSPVFGMTSNQLLVFVCGRLEEDPHSFFSCAWRTLQHCRLHVCESLVV